MKNTGTLQVSLPSEREVVLTRVFDAPRRLVFAARTNPTQRRRWSRPRALVDVECEVDLCVGGAWRFVLRGPDGSEMTMYGEYLEIDPPDRIVHTESYELSGDLDLEIEIEVGEEGGPQSVVTTVLTERDGRTTLTATVLYPSQEVRDAVVRSGMEHGAAETYDRLAELLTVRT